MENIRLLGKRPRYETQATRQSLLLQLGQWENDASWKEFFDTYWRLIYSVARQAGLNNEDAHEVVQDTVLSVAKGIGKFKYDPTVCSFKGWLLTLTRRRISDQFRKRQRAVQIGAEDIVDDRATPFIERIPDPRGADLNAVWDQEWERNLLEAALERVKRKANPQAFEVFHLHLVRGQPASAVARTLGVNIAQVYLAKHRVSALLKKELRYLQTRRI